MEILPTIRIEDKMTGRPKLTLADFKRRGGLKYNNKYDYSRITDISSTMKVPIICPVHGLFMQRASNHLSIGGCKLCGNERIGVNRRTPADEFIDDCKARFGEVLTFEKTKYISQRKRITVTCRIHGDFDMMPPVLLKSVSGCTKCYNEGRSFKGTYKLMFEDKHGATYDYSRVEYINWLTPVTIICRKHGPFEQTPKSHFKHGCKKCACEKQGEKNRKNTGHFIMRSELVHDNLYDYSESEYVTNSTPLKIKCRKHGIFEQKPYKHYAGHGCPICRISIGETAVMNCLKSFNLEFEQQKKYDTCRNVLKLPFDFYIPELNTLIEFDGMQHFEPRDIFGGEVAFRRLQEHDKIKDRWTRDNNVALLRIAYVDIKLVREHIENFIDMLPGLENDEKIVSTDFAGYADRGYTII